MLKNTKKKHVRFRKNLQEFGTKVHEPKPRYNRKRLKQQIIEEVKYELQPERPALDIQEGSNP